ncbi:hypothetical protein GBA63_15220 [Rubrobacter tropicus]|uniref:Uncharacterized protein n=1 Tax=Rubrobacter tropicus TaxID=2653851 RepID=A0A6G8QBH6_9ACTN|nr:hypothetical protein [Rubrobacter tropicus]QIN83836.1 hypothetical protein GBA63_15220 [Rubrobacter tropicus]
MSTEAHPSAETGRTPPLARVVAWLTVPLYVAGICAYGLLTSSAGFWSENPAENVETVAFDIGFGAFAVVGAVLVAKRPTNPIGWILAVVALMLAIFLAGGAYATYVMVTYGRPDWLAVLGAWTFNWFWYLMLALGLIYLPMLFPDGRLLSRRWLPVAVLAGVTTAGNVLLNALVETIPVNEAPGYGIENPVGIEGLGRAEDLKIFGVLNGLFLVAGIGSVASVVVRFRRSRGVERQQMKLFAFVTVVLLGGAVLTAAVSDATGARWLDGSSFVLSMVGFVSLPVAVGVAILRYRLYDMDLVINRALVYGPLTASLAAVYLGGVVSLQYAFRVLTGGGSQLAVVVSTLAIAAMFNPLRRRIQAFIDRRFYRKKYDAARTVEAFSARLRDETDLDALSEDLVSVVRETMQPEHAGLWRREPGGGP